MLSGGLVLLILPRSYRSPWQKAIGTNKQTLLCGGRGRGGELEGWRRKEKGKRCEEKERSEGGVVVSE